MELFTDNIPPTNYYELQLKTNHPLKPAEYVYWRTKYEGSEKYKKFLQSIGCVVDIKDC